MAEKSRFSLRNICVVISVLCLAVLLGGGSLLPDVFDKMQLVELKSVSAKLMPALIKLLTGAFIFSISYLLYRPAKTTLGKTLDSAGASQRGRTMVMRSLQLGYWTIATFVIASVVAPEVLGKLFLGISVFTAALALALKDIAADLFSGTLLQVTRRFNVGDSIAMIGLDVKGKVVDIGYLSTQVKNEEGIQIVPNREMWGKSVKVLKVKSAIILPPGYDLKPKAAPVVEDTRPTLFKLFKD
jgi:small-conductance mechanosensitive channel